MIPKCTFNSQQCGYINRYYDLLEFQNKIINLCQKHNMTIVLGNDDFAAIIDSHITKMKKMYIDENNMVREQIFKLF